jgi:hypothetical protein
MMHKGLHAPVIGELKFLNVIVEYTNTEGASCPFNRRII